MPGPPSSAVRDAATVPDADVSDATSEAPWNSIPPPDNDELVGTTFNDTYVVESVIGEGGMGRVYRARHTRIEQKQFAIKVVRPELTRNSEVLARFRREAEAAACISNSNVVGVYDIGSTSEGWNYLVCEYLDGVDLAAHIEKVKRVDVATAAHIAYNVCDGLAAAHAEGVIHRDLKPHNVFLMRDKSGFIPAQPGIKLLDFGLSRFQDANDTTLTKTGVIMGTPAYMAPEQASGKRVDHRADVYGVGAILYVALTGRPPFVEETVQMVVLSVLGKDPLRPRELNPDIPENLELVIQKAMSKEPDERYQTVDDLARALEPFLQGDSKAAASVGRPQMATRGSLEADAHEVRSARTRLVMLALFGFVALIAALASAVTGVELLTGKLTLTPTELALLLLAVLGTSLTPTLLLLRSFKKRVWHSNVKVLDALDQLKTPIWVALMAYALGGIAIRLVDHVVGRFAWQSLVVSGSGAGWPGWNLMLPLVALCAAGATLARRRWLKGDVRPFRRTLLGFPYGAVIVMILGAILYGGFKWRAHSAKMVVAPVPEMPAGKAAALASSRATPLPKAALSAVKERERPIKRAPEDELTKAVAKGVDGLLPLSERYPRDAAVLKPLMFAFASRATTLADAMAIAQRLVEVAPEETADSQLRYLVRKGAQTPGQAAKLAFDLMAHDMGRAGPDLLYDLWLTSPKARERAGALLKKQEVRAKFSPELAVAYDLRLAESCEAKVPLLERAAQLGDERSLAQLSPLATKSKKGCGRWKRNPCPPPCAKQARDYMTAIRAISKRVNARR